MSAIPELYVATAMIAPERTEEFWRSWREQGVTPFVGRVVVNNPDQSQMRWSDTEAGALEAMAASLRTKKALSLLDAHTQYRKEILGTVPAFAAAVEGIPDSAIIALLHDDLRIDEPGWDARVMEFFQDHPSCVLAGFGGAYGVGRRGMYNCPGCGGPDMYDKEETDLVCACADPATCVKANCGKVRFDPMTLARHHFMSNMQDAEAHGERVATARPVAVLDGFSLIGRGWFIKEALQLLMSRGVVHHAYDVGVGALARRKGLQTWLIPVRCHHAGGRSAVGSREYQEWAQKNHGGDQAVWLHAHRMVWEEFRDVLPFDVREER